MHCLKFIGKYVYAVHIVTMLQAEKAGVQFLAGAKICLCSPCSDYATGCTSWGSVPGRGKRFPYFQNVQTGYGTHSASYSMSTVGCFPGTKLPGHKMI